MPSSQVQAEAAESTRIRPKPPPLRGSFLFTDGAISDNCFSVIRLLSCLLLLLLATNSSRSEPVDFFPDWFPGAQFAGIYVALDQGFYRDAGIELTIAEFGFGQKAAELIDARPERGALGAMEGYIFLQTRAQRVDLRALAAMLQESPAGFMSLESAGITRAVDFRGKRVGVHRFADPLYRWFLTRAGISERETTMVFSHDDVSLVVKGELDALQGYSTEEFLRFRRLAGEAARFLSFKDLGFDSYSELLVTTPAQLARHGDALGRFVHATRRGWVHALENPQAAVSSVASRLKAPVDLVHIRASLDALRPIISPAEATPLQPMSVAKWTRMQSVCREMGFLEQEEPIANFLVEPTRP